MNVEYAVLDQDGNMMGIPAKSWPTADMASVFRDSLEAARQRAINEGSAAAVVLNGDSGSKDQLARSFRDELGERVARGEHAAKTSYTVWRREVGPWQQI